MLIEVRDASVSFGERQVLSRVSLSLACRSVTAIIGPSGSGKSTLLAAISGEIELSSGQVIRHVPADDIALVVQSSPLLTRRSAVDNVRLAALIRGHSESEAAENSRRILAALGLASRASSPVRVLSGGERQRLGVARAIVSKPAVILADEPTASLDAESRERMIRVLRSAAEGGAAVVVATHDAYVSGLCDSTIRLDAA